MLRIANKTAVVSLTIDAMAVTHYADLYPASTEQSSGRTSLPVASSLESIWPRFQSVGSDTGFVVLPSQTPRTIGRVVVDNRLTNAGGAVAYATAGSDAAGYLSFGPYALLRPVTYDARFELAATGTQPDDPAVTLDVFVMPDFELARRELRLADFPFRQDYGTFDVPFAVPAWDHVEVRVYYPGSGSVWLKSISVKPANGPDPASDAFPDWPVSLLWVLGTGFVAVLIASDRSSARREHPRSSSRRP